MEKICFTNIGNLKIEGIQNDYVFETIRKSGKFYENDLLLKWLPYICKSKIILDIGANLGNHTLFWSENINYEKIYSFEPLTENYERLYNNIAIHNKKANIVIINKGVGQKKGYTGIKEFHEDNYGGTTLDPSILDNGEIEITDIDSFTVENQISQIDFIKIDTEGFETSVLSGMKKTLTQYYPDLWVEISHESFHEIIQTLQVYGYTLVDIDGFNLLFMHKNRHDSIQPLNLDNILGPFFYNLERVNKYYKNYLISKQWLASKESMLINSEENFTKCKEQNALLSERLADASEKYRSALNNYETAKLWITERDSKLENAGSEIAALKEKNSHLTEDLVKATSKYKEAADHYNTAKDWISKRDKQIDELQKKVVLQAEEIERLEHQNQDISLKLQDITLKANDMSLLLSECMKDYDFNIMNAEQISRAIRKLEIQNSALIQKNSEMKGKLDIIDNSKIGRLGIKIYGFYKRHLRKLG